MDNRGLDKKGFENVDNDVTGEIFEDFNANEEEFNRGEAAKSDDADSAAEKSIDNDLKIDDREDMTALLPDTKDVSVDSEVDDFKVGEDNKLSDDAVKKIIRIVEKHDDNPALLNDEINKIGKKIRGIS